jgi:hypothetical protein
MNVLQVPWAITIILSISAIGSADPGCQGICMREAQDGDCPGWNSTTSQLAFGLAAASVVGYKRCSEEGGTQTHNSGVTGSVYFVGLFGRPEIGFEWHEYRMTGETTDEYCFISTWAYSDIVGRKVELTCPLGPPDPGWGHLLP